MMRLGHQRRNSVGSYSAASRGDENAPPPAESDAARFASRPTGGTGASAASRPPFLFRAKRQPLAASSSSMYNRKPQLPAPKPKTGSGVRVPGNTPAPLSGKRLRRASSGEVPPYKSSLLKNVPVPPANLDACSDDGFMRNTESSGEMPPYKGSLLKNVPVPPANLEACSDEGFIRNTESRLSLELECHILKTTFGDKLKAANFHFLEACRQKEAIQKELNGTRETLESNLLDLIKELNELKEANDKSLELLKERDIEIQRLNSELEKANVNRKYQQDDVSRQIEDQTELITNLATEQKSIQLQLEASKANELLATQNLGEIELLLDESIETILQKVVLEQYYASLVMGIEEEAHRLVSHLEQSKSCYKGGRVKDPEIKMEEMDDQVAASRISRNKEEEIRKAHAEEKNEILKKNEMLEIISIEDFKEDIYALENEVKKLKKEAQLQRMQREKLEVDLDNLRQQSLVVQSFGNAESSLKNGMADPADSTRVVSCRNNELLWSQERRRICRKEVSLMDSMILGPVNKCPWSSTIRHKQDMGMLPPFEEFMQGSFAGYLEPCADACTSGDIFKEDADISLLDAHVSPHMAKQLDGEMAQPNLSHQEDQPESSEFEHPSPTESESGDQVPPQALKLILEVVEEKELPPVAPVRDRKKLNYALAPSDELKRLRAMNHYEGKRTATDRRFWSIEQQDLYTSIYKSAQIFEMKWIDWEHISSVDQFAGIKERCALLGLEQIMSYCCPWDVELIRQFYSTVHISTDKSSITWMADGRKITTNKRAWEERFGITGGVRTQIHSQFWLHDDDKRILYTAEDCIPGQTSGLSPLTIIAKKIIWSTIYPRSGNTIDGHNWNLLFHIVKQHPFDIIALLFGEIDLIISGRNGTKDLLFYAPYIMGMIMRAYEYDGPRKSKHNSYKPRPYKQKPTRKFSCSPAPAVAAPSEPPPSAFQKIVAEVDGDNNHQLDAAGHQAQGEAVHGQGPKRRSLADVSVQPAVVRPSPFGTFTRHSLAGVSAKPAIARPSPFGRFPWYQREK